MKEFVSNGFANSIAQAIEEMKAEKGDFFSLESIKLAELERRTSVSRGKLRRLKRNGFQALPHSQAGESLHRYDPCVSVYGRSEICPHGQREKRGHLPGHGGISSMAEGLRDFYEGCGL